MTVSLYDLSVGSFTQSIDGLQKVLAKAKEFADANDDNADDYLELQLHESMLSLKYQLLFARHHTLGCLDALRSGQFSPPSSYDTYNFEEMQAMLVRVGEELGAAQAEELDALANKSVIFAFKDVQIPFTASNFVMSFCLPNLHFHATTAYDILRQKGVPLSKSDFLGQLRMGV